MASIHELTTWPKFTGDLAALAASLAAIRHRQGLHLGRIQALGFDLGTEANLAASTVEVVQSSAVEGELLDSAEVRSSIAGRLGLDVAGLPIPSRAVEGVVDMMLDATQHDEQPMTVERLWAWHAALFPTGHRGQQALTLGAWRSAESGPMQVVSGALGKERVHFQAPEAARIAAEMDQFLSWFNARSDRDPVLTAALRISGLSPSILSRTAMVGSRALSQSLPSPAVTGCRSAFIACRRELRSSAKNIIGNWKALSADRWVSPRGSPGFSAVWTGPWILPMPCWPRFGVKRSCGRRARIAQCMLASVWCSTDSLIIGRVI